MKIKLELNMIVGTLAIGQVIHVVCKSQQLPKKCLPNQGKFKNARYHPITPTSLGNHEIKWL